MPFKPPFWLSPQFGTQLFPRVIQAPPAVRWRVDASKNWFELNPEGTRDIAANRIFDRYSADISNFVRRQRVRYDSAGLEVQHTYMALPGLTAEYLNLHGREIVTLIAQPESAPTGVSFPLPGVIVVGGDPRDLDGATVAWFSASAGGFVEFANNASAPIAPDLTGLVFASYGSGTTPVPALPASCTVIDLARGNWSIAKWTYTEFAGGANWPVPKPSGRIIYDAKGVILPALPTMTRTQIAGVTFYTPADLLALTPDAIWGEIDFGGGNLWDFDTVPYITNVAGGLEVIDAAQISLYKPDGSVLISQTSILPAGRFSSTTASVQDTSGNSYLIESDTGSGIWATKRDPTGALLWEYPLDYNENNPVAIAHGGNFVAVLCSPPYTFQDATPSSWGANTFDGVGLYTPPFLARGTGFSTSAAAVAAIQAYPDYLYWGYDVPVVTATGDLVADSASLRAELDAVQATAPLGGYAQGVYGSNGSPAQLTAAPSKIFVLSAGAGQRVQTIPWGTAKLQTVSIPGDVDAHVIRPGSLNCAASSPLY